MLPHCERSRLLLNDTILSIDMFFEIGLMATVAYCREALGIRRDGRCTAVNKSRGRCEHLIHPSMPQPICDQLRHMRGTDPDDVKRRDVGKLIANSIYNHHRSWRWQCILRATKQATGVLMVDANPCCMCLNTDSTRDTSLPVKRLDCVDGMGCRCLPVAPGHLCKRVGLHRTSRDRLLHGKHIATCRTINLGSITETWDVED